MTVGTACYVRPLTGVTALLGRTPGFRPPRPGTVTSPNAEPAPDPARRGPDLTPASLVERLEARDAARGRDRRDGQRRGLQKVARMLHAPGPDVADDRLPGGAAEN